MSSEQSSVSSGSISLMTAHCVEPRRRHKRIENPLLAGIVGGGDLRMPLDSHQPGMLRQFRGFNRPILGLGLGHYAKTIGQSAHGLVMPGGRFDFPCAQNIGQTALPIHRQRMQRIAANLGVSRRRVAVGDGLPHFVGQMLHQRAAQRHIQDLNPPTDAQ